MKNQKGFSLIELLIVVAIIGIIAAIAIPALLQARIAANESAVKADTKALVASNATYAAQNNQAYASNLTCLGDPAGANGGACPAGSIGSWPAGTAAFMDQEMACMPGAPGTTAPGTAGIKKGYSRTYAAAAACVPGPCPGTQDVGSLTYTYIADPTSPQNTGNQYFTADHTGLLCQQTSGPFPGGGVANPVGAACVPI